MFGQYDIGFLCELLFYARDHNGLHIVKECSTIDSRHICRGNWQTTAAISYLCHLSSIATPDGAHAPELYHLLSSTLTKITITDKSHRNIAAHSLWFELQLLNIQGLPPQLNRCTSCDMSITTSLNMLFSATEGGVVCSNCHASGRAKDCQQLSGDTLAILRRIQSASDFIMLQAIRISKIQQNQMQQLLGAFLTYHLDLSPSCRSVAYRMFGIEPMKSKP